MLHLAPKFTATDAERLFEEHWGVAAHASPLTSERDQNFLISTSDGPHAVLKIANALEDPAMLQAQQAALAHVARSFDLCPRVIPTRGGGGTATVTAGGKSHALWAVSFLRGIPLGKVRRRPPALLEDLGRRVGALTRALEGFDHPAIHRDFYWDLANARRAIDQYRPLLTEARDRECAAAIDTLAARFDAETAPLLPQLHRSVVHNDLNDFNILVDAADPFTGREATVTGFVDFGDMVHSYTVSDLAIAAAYIAIGSGDPLTDAAHVVRGCHASAPLAEIELSALFGLIAMRLCASACIAAHQRRERPDNAYLDVSQEAVRRTLPVLAATPSRLAEAIFRDACGLSPVLESRRVAHWLDTHRKEFAPVMLPWPPAGPLIPLDLGMESPLLSGDSRENDEPALTARIAAQMRARNATLAVGRYAEVRLIYTAPAFAPQPGSGGERRMLHLGVDLFTEAGTPVYAPIEGTVHAFADNDAPQDYGPVIVLRHATDDGTPFFTLYGHLSRTSLHGLRVGAPVRRGERIATLGTAAENGNWTPHLHLQLITDALALDTDFPGVGRTSQEKVWRSLSPDPDLVIALPNQWRKPLTTPTARLLERRRERIGASLSVAYDEPVHAVRGWRQFLYDADGRQYLDAYNNVPHVGHCHPRVVEAAHSQMALLNTNTRYVTDRVIEYAESLTARFPKPLTVCYLLNSASEANELALRLARAYTRARDMIVLEAAYHGNTTSLIELSPYKHAGPGGAGAPDWVHVAPLPDDYRGPYRREDPEAGPKYAAHVADLLSLMTSKYRRLAGFIAESCPSVGGQIMLPPRYLEEVYRLVRGAGGVCIADEVQTGLGRTGTHEWAFEAQGVVPDIVVLGKPLGNGHPLAAVVTTPAIAAAFANGMEFFSTFGGNTVSCAVGLAVLEVMDHEGLQAHARATGDRMLGGLRGLMDRYEVIGDVRGSGLFLGVELVRDRATREPCGTCGVIRRQPLPRSRHPPRHQWAAPQCREDPAADALRRRGCGPRRGDLRPHPHRGFLMTPTHPAANAAQLRTADARSRLEAAKAKRFIELFKHGSLTVEYYAPRGQDPQTPHSRDELYVVATGRGVFWNGSVRAPFQPGDLLFVAAGVPHRFEEFTDDFGTWVMFYGPEGGERP